MTDRLRPTYNERVIVLSAERKQEMRRRITAALMVTAVSIALVGGAFSASVGKIWD